MSATHQIAQASFPGNSAQVKTEMNAPMSIKKMSFPHSRSESVAFLSSLSNEELLNRFRSGETQAAHVLLQRYEGMIYALAYRLAGNYDDANDVVAEAYLRLCLKLGTCGSAVALPAWINRVVSNAFFDLRRRSQRRPTVSLDSLTEASGDVYLPIQEDGASSPQHYVETQERKQMLEHALTSLPGSQRRILKLFYQEQQTYEEISMLLGIAVGTVKSRLSRARTTLQQKLSVHQSVLMS